MSNREEPFRFESEMRSPVLKWLVDQGLDARLEVQMPWGIADIVAVKWNRRQVHKRLGYRQFRQVGSTLRFSILESIPDVESGRSADISELSEIHGPYYSVETLTRHLTGLTKARFIVRTENGHYQKLNGWQPLQQTLVSVELKLHRFREAQSQAQGNCGAVNESYVAFPSAHAMRIARSARGAELRDEGIGLLAVDLHNCRRIIPPQRRNTPMFPIIEAHLVEKFWPNVIKGS